jgi:hypothetical protein
MRVCGVETRFNVGDIIEHENSYYGLIVKAFYTESSIYLEVLNSVGSIRQLNLMISGSGDYRYRVVNV